MVEIANKSSGQCECGENKFKISGKPILRAICHCEICQEFNSAPFGDITIFKTKDIDLPKDNTVVFKAYTTPPMVQRGKCKSCGKPTIEFLKMPLSPALTIVPTKNLSNQQDVLEPSFHSFYHRRKADADDNLPKYSGFLRSQVGFMTRLIGAMIKG